MLVSALRDGLHVPPVTDAGWRGRDTILPAPRDAPKLTPRDRQVDWASPGWSAAAFQLRSRVLGHPWTRALHVSGAMRRVILEGVEEVEPSEEVAVFMRRLRRRIRIRTQKASQDETNEVLSITQQQATCKSQVAEEAQAELDDSQSDVRTVTWIQEVDESENMPDHQKNWREFRLPYFPAGDAILIPAIGGGCVRIPSIKLEGEKSKLAARAIKDLTDNRNVHTRDLTDSIADSIMLPVVGFSLFDWL
jgi:methionyl-tRNA formyltransferase